MEIKMEVKFNLKLAAHAQVQVQVQVQAWAKQVILSHWRSVVFGAVKGPRVLGQSTL
jgi:hypothetical protein